MDKLTLKQRQHVKANLEWLGNAKEGGLLAVYAVETVETAYEIAFLPKCVYTIFVGLKLF